MLNVIDVLLILAGLFIAFCVAMYEACWLAQYWSGWPVVICLGFFMWMWWISMPALSGLS